MSKQKGIFSFFLSLLLCCGLVLTGTGCAKQEEPEKPVEVVKPEEPQEEKEEDKRSQDPKDPVNRKIDWKKYQDENSDVYAWIYIPGTTVDYPILMSAKDADTHFYLTHDIDGNSSIFGSVYAENFQEKDFSDPVTVLYGHSYFDGNNQLIWNADPAVKMFTDLHKYEDGDYLNENPKMYIYTPEKTYVYDIFSARVFDDRYISYSYEFEKDAEFEEYLKDITAAGGNLNKNMPEITPESGIVTLSTCVGVGSDQRYIVSATRTEEWDAA